MLRALNVLEAEGVQWLVHRLPRENLGLYYVPRDGAPRVLLDPRLLDGDSAIARSVVWEETAHHFTLPAGQSAWSAIDQGTWGRRARGELDEERALLWAGAHCLTASDWRWATEARPRSLTELAGLWDVSEALARYALRARHLARVARRNGLDLSYVLSCSGPRAREQNALCRTRWLCCSCEYWGGLCLSGLCPDPMQEEKWPALLSSAC